MRGVPPVTTLFSGWSYERFPLLTTLALFSGRSYERGSTVNNFGFVFRVVL